MGIVERYDEQGERLERGGELARLGRSESGRFALKLHFRLIIVRGGLATANGGGTRECEFALGLSREVEDIRIVVLVRVVKTERGEFVRDKERERTCPTLNGDRKEFPRNALWQERQEVGFIHFNRARIELRGVDSRLANVVNHRRAAT